MNENPHLIIDYQLRGEFRMQVYEGWSPFYELKDPRYRELTISMAEWEGLAIVTLVGLKK